MSEKEHITQRVRPSVEQKAMMAGFIRQRQGKPRKEILQGLKKYLRSHGNYKVPANKTLLNLISEITGARDQEGWPWTIGAKGVEIPAEAIRAVVQCWREARMWGERLTIRQAKWCAKLWPLMPSVEDSTALHVWALVYANRELAYEIMDKPEELDTADLDEVMTTPPWELTTRFMTGEVGHIGQGINRGGHRKLPWDFTIVPTRPTLTRLALNPAEVHADAMKAERSFLFGPSLPKELRPVLTYQPVGELGWSQEAETVYTLWLRHLAQGPRIKEPTPKMSRSALAGQVRGRLNIVLALREWVSNHKLAKDSSPLWSIAQPEFIGFVYDKSAEDMMFPPLELKPTEVLRKVGYKI